MLKKSDSLIDVEEINDHEDIQETDAVKRRQLDRFGICLAIQDVLESIYGPYSEAEEPHLTNSADEESDLITNIKFKGGTIVQLGVPYEGQLYMSNPDVYGVFLCFRDRFGIALGKYVLSDIKKVIRERI